MARNLRPGGRVVGINDTTEDGITGARDFTRHGFRKVGPNPYREGSLITYDLFLPEGRSFTITNYFWTRDTYLAALGEAGFREAAWHALEVSPRGVSDFPPGFFSDLLEHAPIAAFTATR